MDNLEREHTGRPFFGVALRKAASETGSRTVDAFSVTTFVVLFADLIATACTFELENTPFKRCRRNRSQSRRTRSILALSQHVHIDKAFLSFYSSPLPPLRL